MTRKKRRIERTDARLLTYIGSAACVIDPKGTGLEWEPGTTHVVSATDVERITKLLPGEPWRVEPVELEAPRLSAETKTED